MLIDKDQLIAFRRLCVEYGGARVQLGHATRSETPALMSQLDHLWAQIEQTERDMTERGPGLHATAFDAQRLFGITPTTLFPR